MNQLEMSSKIGKGESDSKGKVKFYCDSETSAFNCEMLTMDCANTLVGNPCNFYDYRLALNVNTYSEYQNTSPETCLLYEFSDRVNFNVNLFAGEKKEAQLNILPLLSPQKVARMISSFMESEFSIFKNTVSKSQCNMYWKIESRYNVLKISLTILTSSILSTIIFALIINLYHACNSVFSNIFPNHVPFTQSEASPLLHHLSIAQVHIGPKFYLSGGCRY